MLDDDSKWKLEPFQEAFVADLFSGFLEVWFILPEGNGKTTLIAGIALYHCEFKPSASVPVAASSRDQAEILYGQAEGLVLRTPRLRNLFKCLPGYRRIKCTTNGAKIQVWAADERTGDGVIPTLAITEELHRHRDLKLYRTWRGKVKKRKGQIVAISTAGEPGSEFEQTRTRMRESGHQVTRETCFTRAAAETTVIHDWAVPEKADVEDLDVVKAANPFSGVTRASLREDRASATMTLQHWGRFKCNRPTRSHDAAITEAEWAHAATEERIPEGQPIWLGLDVGWKHDTTAMVPLWIRDPDFRLLGPATIIVPPRNGNSLHPDEIKHALLQIHERNPIHTISMDMTYAEDIAAYARDEIGATVIDHSQSNAQQSMDYDAFMEALRNRKLRHCGDVGLRQHAMNAVSRMLPAGDHVFERAKSTRAAAGQALRVIDALVAAAMVHGDAAADLKSGDGEVWIAWA